MSGIAGLLQLDGALVDRQLLRHMTEFLCGRGPDAQRMWAEGPVGFGHAMLRTTEESQGERQPCTLDGQVWITADARIDGRAELIEKLESAGRCDVATANDAELILHAYATWGEECVQRLLGDFCFAIWDGWKRHLFCARDHLGVKPFFYAHVGDRLIFSNTLNCVRLHPSISDELNEQTIGDFLLFDFNQDLASTAFAHIRRLPPAHTLTSADGTLRLRRYWALEVKDPIRYERATEYVEHFQELLAIAVEDRLRTNRISVLMGGGLDSTAGAATAHGILSKRGCAFDLRAHTVTYDRLIRHQERHYAGLVAGALRIPIHYLVADNYRLYERTDQTELQRPEPFHDPLAAIEADLLCQASAHSRVLLTGYGGDPAFASLLSSHFRKMLRERRIGQALVDLADYLTAEGRLSRLYLRTRLRRWFSATGRQDSFPTWLEEDYARRLDLRARWQQLNHLARTTQAVRPEACEAVTAPMWPYLFEGYDPGMTSLPLEVRHPFFDLRLLNFLLALPALPCCSDKELLRAAMRGILPDAVRLRPKTPLPGDPFVVHLRQPESQWVDRFEPTPALGRYVVPSRIPRVAGEKDSWSLWINLRPLSLNNWLQSLAVMRYKSGAGAEHLCLKIS